MAGCAAEENAWQVRICKGNGESAGAGVMLGADLVLTCAHVVDDAGGGTGQVRVDSVLCRPRWSRNAAVIPGCWVSEHGTQRGDLAVLRMDSPVECHQGTRLWKSPVRDVEVWVHGFPDRGRVGVTAEGRLVGSSYDGDWVEMHPPIGYLGQWVTLGFSGAGVVERETGYVVGLLVAVRESAGKANAWMMPSATIAGYLPAVRPLTDGIDAVDDTFDHSVGDGFTGPESGVDRALRAEVRRLLGGTWSGTAAITGTAGTPWLARLVATADPAVRRRLPETVTSADVALGIGAVDFAMDAKDCTVTEILERIGRRFAVPADDPARLIDRLEHRRPPPTIVVDRVDSARDPGRLVSELLAPLAARARRHGIRLVLVFAGQPPDNLPYELSLGPEPVTGQRDAADADADAVGRRLASLALDEADVRDRYAEVSRLTAGAPRPLPAIAPRLRVRAAVADAAELSAIYHRAGEALASTARAMDELTSLKRQYDDLRQTLGVYADRVESRFGAEDPDLRGLYGVALETLRTGPCDLVAARKAVDTYIDAARGRPGWDDREDRP